MSDESILSAEVLAANRRLLDSIIDGDWATYQELCDPTITAFEPEGRGHMIEGMEFHHFYFYLGGSPAPHNVTVCAPHVRFLGQDVAIVAYVRIVQRLGDDGKPVTARSEETRVWQRQAGKWRHVHFHRSV